MTINDYECVIVYTVYNNLYTAFLRGLNVSPSYAVFATSSYADLLEFENQPPFPPIVIIHDKLTLEIFLEHKPF